MKSLRNPLIFGTLGFLFAAGCIVLITSGTAASLLVLLVLPFGLPQGICSNANQAAVYVQAPHEEVGTAAGLLRTSQYVVAPLSLPVCWACCSGNTRPITDCTRWPGSWSS